MSRHTVSPHLFRGVCTCACPACTDHPGKEVTRCICTECDVRACGAREGVVTRGDRVLPAPTPGPRRDRGGSGLGVVLFAVAIAVLAVLGFLSVAQEFQRSACESVAGTPAACEEAP